MSAHIHPTAIVDSRAQLADDVVVGPFCIIGPDVTLDAGAHLKSHVTIEGHTSVGEGTVIYPFSSLGTPPQSSGYKGEPTTLEVGKFNQIREHVTMNRGTADGRGKTVVGNHCQIMVGAHVGHDCIVGDNVIMANNATLGGHVTLGDRVNVGGLAAIHQRVRVGEGAMVSGTAGVKHDVIPYGTVMVPGSEVEGLNIVGMKRSGASRDDINALRSAFKMLVKDGNLELSGRLLKIEKTYGDRPIVQKMLTFIQADNARSLSLPLGSKGKMEADSGGNI